MVEAVNGRGYTVEQVGGGRTRRVTGTSEGGRGSSSGKRVKGRVADYHWKPGVFQVDGQRQSG